MKKLSLIVFTLIFIVTSRLSRAEVDINCRAKHTLSHGDVNIVAFYHFLLSKHMGVVSINGKLTYNGVETTIGRAVYFNYSILNTGNYVAKSYNVVKIPTDNSPDEVVENHYPLFFTENDKSLLIRIKNVSVEGYIISFVRTPLFYCTVL